MYTNNIIFFDGEFNGLNPNGIDFLSMAFISNNGNELYIELEQPKKIDPWVKDNVCQFLDQEKISIEQAKKEIDNFIEKNYGYEKAYTHAMDGEQKRNGGASRIKPFLMADVNQFDWMGICGIFGVWELPFHYISIDFASILFSHNYDPDIDRIKFAKSRGIETKNFTQHHALDDCRVLKELYERII